MLRRIWPLNHLVGPTHARRQELFGVVLRGIPMTRFLSLTVPSFLPVIGSLKVNLLYAAGRT